MDKMKLQPEIDNFLSTFNRSPRTVREYRNALRQFQKIVGENSDLNSENYAKFLLALKHLSPSTQRVYRTAVLKLYAYCKAGNWADLKEITEHYTRKQGKRIVTFKREELETVISFCDGLRGDLEALRDRAFVLTLADTGLRISEACALKRGDVDWTNRRAVIVGKGDKQAVIHFSNRAIAALRDYLRVRASLDGNSPTALADAPLFARHDMRASKRVRPITSSGMWKAVKSRMEEAGVDRHTVRLHDFRHYFVTVVYQRTGDIKRAQELARHESIATTNRYTHLVGEAAAAYDEIFNRPAQ
jgi:integrase/recombinase XerC